MTIARKTRAKSDAQALKNYENCVAQGFYGRNSGGLDGKYDNVRRYWEDQITRYTLHDFAAGLTQRKRVSRSQVRVLDLGAGSGEGYEVITSLKKPGTLVSEEVDVLPRNLLGHYKGLDISPAMVEQGRQIYHGNRRVEFEVADLSQGLGPVADDPPYDVYFSSYGSLSHLRDDEIRHLVEDIYDNADGSFIFVADLVGRYSYEWPGYWNTPADETNMRQYSMSYLYPREMLGKIEVERFPLRYWHAEEFAKFFESAMFRKGGRILRKSFVDRSILVGRHMNTGEYNPNATPLRRHVNSLHEFNRRTDLRALLFTYHPHPEFPDLDAFFSRFAAAWNAVIHAAIEALKRWKDKKFLASDPDPALPKGVREAVRTIRRVVMHIEWFRMGDPRANILEPQLGYILRNVEMDLQEGRGAGHGLLATYEVRKGD